MLVAKTRVPKFTLSWQASSHNSLKATVSNHCSSTLISPSFNRGLILMPSLPLSSKTPQNCSKICAASSRAQTCRFNRTAATLNGWTNSLSLLEERQFPRQRMKSILRRSFCQSSGRRTSRTSNTCRISSSSAKDRRTAICISKVLDTKSTSCSNATRTKTTSMQLYQLSHCSRCN